METRSSYLQSVNTSFLLLLVAHIPVLCGVALYFGAGLGLAAGLGLLFVAGPAVLFFSDRGSKLTSVALGIAAMCFSALLIHLSGGMLEMHFHIFTMLALMIAFQFAWPLVASATAIAVHHIAFFIWLPHSLFSYQASWGIVFLHAFFVIFEVVPALWLTHLLQKSFASKEAAEGELNKMSGGLLDVIRETSRSFEALSTTSTELFANSKHMQDGSRQASDRAHAVANAAEKMSSNIGSVAAGMKETAANLNNVANATAGMTTTINEIYGNSEKARRITGEATRQAAQINEQMSQLGQAAQEIGKITETITEISSQTNLLALNATIEAARAGAAGKGFAVVATEIKALAQQTAAATEDIKARIKTLQNATTGGIEQIQNVAVVIHEVTETVSMIAGSINEQANVAKDVAHNIAEASAGVTSANGRVSQTSQVSSEIAKDIINVDRIAGEMARGSEHVLNSAGEISGVAIQLKEAISRFQTFYDKFFAEREEHRRLGPFTPLRDKLASAHGLNSIQGQLTVLPSEDQSAFKRRGLS